MKKVFSLLLSLLICVPCFGAGYMSDNNYIAFETDELICGYYTDVQEKYVIVQGLTDAGKEKEEITIPPEINGMKVKTILPFSSKKLKRLIIPKHVILGSGDRWHMENMTFELPALEFVNLENADEILRFAFSESPKLGSLASCNSIKLNGIPGSNALRGTAFEKVTFNCDITAGSLPYLYPSGVLMNCTSLRTAHFTERQLAVPSDFFKNDINLDYVYLSRSTEIIEGSAFKNCQKLRTVILPSKNARIICAQAERAWAHTGCGIDSDGNSDADDIFCAFYNCHNLTVIGMAETQAEEYAERHGVPFIPAIINHGEPSTVVAQAQQTATVTINGVDIPAYTVNGSVYIGESALRSLGFTAAWDGEARKTTITAPEDADWSVQLNTNPNPYPINVVSSDVEFWYNGFRIPALNVGNGESIIDVNALAEKVLY